MQILLTTLTFLFLINAFAEEGTYSVSFDCKGNYSDKYNNKYARESGVLTISKLDRAQWANVDSASNYIGAIRLYYTHANIPMLALYTKNSSGPSLEKSYTRKSEGFAAWTMEDIPSSSRVRYSKPFSWLGVSYDVSLDCDFEIVE